MSEIKKYMFDVKFDLAKEKKKKNVKEALVEKEIKIEAPPPPPPPPPPPTFSEEELKKAREEGKAEGIAEERKKAEESIKRLQTETLKVVAIELATIQEKQKDANKQIANDCLHIILAAAKKMFPTMAERHGMEEIEEFVKQCMPLLFKETRIIIHVNENILELLRTTLTEIATNSGYEGQFLVTGDKKIKTGDCRIEWNSGGIEKNNEKLWEDIERIIADNTLPSKTTEANNIN